MGSLNTQAAVKVFSRTTYQEQDNVDIKIIKIDITLSSWPGLFESWIALSTG